ncbi:MAG: hypothetical protein Q9157_005968 [Trypethelium eluteriae]
MGPTVPIPVMYLLEDFPPAAISRCRTLFKIIDSSDPQMEDWRGNAFAILIREKTISAEDISQAYRLRVIGKQRVGIGIGIIDQDACAKRGTPILNTPGANTQPVAQLVLSLIMPTARQLRTISVKQAAGEEVRKEHFSGIYVQCGGFREIGGCGLRSPLSRSVLDERYVDKFLYKSGTKRNSDILSRYWTPAPQFSKGPVAP